MNIRIRFAIKYVMFIVIACNESFIPFIAIHKPPVKFKSFRREIFIPHVEIGVTIVDYERNLTTHLLNPNLYVNTYLLLQLLM